MAEVRRKRRPGGSVGTPAAEPEGDGPADRPMTPDEWQAHVTRAAALEILKKRAESFYDPLLVANFAQLVEATATHT